ncbi:MAG TPA: HypC/HybG/HupF family hydrogenase formation chaperone [Coriobacteriia bacterium]
MCLAIPAQVILMNENQMAEVDIHGVTRTVSLSMTPEAEVGSWVLIHAGFAIQVVDEEFAAESWELIEQIEWDDGDVASLGADTAEVGV